MRTIPDNTIAEGVIYTTLRSACMVLFYKKSIFAARIIQVL